MKPLKFNCERCGFSTNYRSNFVRHLKRKFICESKLSIISIEDLKIKFGLIKKNKKKLKKYVNFVVRIYDTTNFIKTFKNGL